MKLSKESGQCAGKRSMVFFITVLRTLAACLITNAHYSGIYPIDLLANGGLLGDILFFAVSGYCLYNVKQPFFSWYGKRLLRIYPAVIIATVFYLATGAYSLSEHTLGWWLIYPTGYHFVASILVLYIPYYFVMRTDWLKNHMILLMGVTATIYVIIYFTVYDKSYYHIDTVREPMIRFLFMESMLLGAWFRQRDASVRNHFRGWEPFAAGITFFLYFASKLLFSRRESLSQYQICNQLLIFALLFFLLLTFAGIDFRLEKLPAGIKRMIGFISGITLEIYVVQYVLIDMIRPIGHFPLNWLALTVAIIAAAVLLHKLCVSLTVTIYRIGQRLLENSQGGVNLESTDYRCMA